MKKLWKWTLTGLFILQLTACSKEKSDPADIFVGNYTYEMTESEDGKPGDVSSGKIRICKVSENKVSLTQFRYGGSPIIYYTVSNNKIIEDAGHVVYAQMADGKVAGFEETSEGFMTGNRLNLVGSLAANGYQSFSFQIEMVKE